MREQYLNKRLLQDVLELWVVQKLGSNHFLFLYATGDQLGVNCSESSFLIKMNIMTIRLDWDFVIPISFSQPSHFLSPAGQLERILLFYFNWDSDVIGLLHAGLFTLDSGKCACTCICNVWSEHELYLSKDKACSILLEVKDRKVTKKQVETHKNAKQQYALADHSIN